MGAVFKIVLIEINTPASYKKQILQDTGLLKPLQNSQAQLMRELFFAHAALFGGIESVFANRK